jgi:hypothetical protein
MGERGRVRLRPIDLVFRCIAWPEREGSRPPWRAVCIDLDLWANGASANEAHLRLRQAITGYLETVFDTKDAESIPRLIRRRAPLRYRLLWHLVSVYRLVKPRKDAGPHRFKTTPPMHLGSVTA